MFPLRMTPCYCLRKDKIALRGALQILDKFRVWSGVKLDLSKCKLLRIGALTNLNLVFCSDHDLEWTNQPVPALISRRSLLKQCKRNHLPELWNTIEEDTKLVKYLATTQPVFYTGKITITSLPNPKDAFSSQLKKVWAICLWNNKPSKIKHTILTNKQTGRKWMYTTWPRKLLSIS